MIQQTLLDDLKDRVRNHPFALDTENCIELAIFIKGKHIPGLPSRLQSVMYSHITDFMDSYVDDGCLVIPKDTRRAKIRFEEVPNFALWITVLHPETRRAIHIDGLIICLDGTIEKADKGLSLGEQLQPAGETPDRITVF